MASVGHNPSARSSARLQTCQNSKPRDRWTKAYQGLVRSACSRAQSTCSKTSTAENAVRSRRVRSVAHSIDSSYNIDSNSALSVLLVNDAEGLPDCCLGTAPCDDEFGILNPLPSLPSLDKYHHNLSGNQAY